MEKKSHLVEQWAEESKQMASTNEERQAMLEKLRSAKVEDVNWNLAIPRLVPEGVDAFDLFDGKVKESKAIVDEHDAVVLGIIEIHKKDGFDKANELSNFYINVFSKRKNAPEENFDFNRLMEAYNASMLK